jgi:hypothetical protein
MDSATIERDILARVIATELVRLQATGEVPSTVEPYVAEFARLDKALSR